MELFETIICLYICMPIQLKRFMIYGTHSVSKRFDYLVFIDFAHYITMQLVMPFRIFNNLEAVVHYCSTIQKLTYLYIPFLLRCIVVVKSAVMKGRMSVYFFQTIKFSLLYTKVGILYFCTRLEILSLIFIRSKGG